MRRLLWTSHKASGAVQRTVAARIGMVATCTLLGAACTDTAKNHTDTTVSAATIAPPVPIRAGPLPARDSVSAHAITWNAAQVVDRLRSAGVNVRTDGAAREPFMSVRGVQLVAPQATLEVYIYGDAIAAARDIDKFDTLKVSANGQRLVWKKPPAIITDNNAVILVRADDDAVRKHIRDAFNAKEHFSQRPRVPSRASKSPE
ncbi:MAG: hypothetical protein M3Z05_16940 [Gemmatimonadota bacterium]|nr:hypothetical protein [Gemmatimonadota bacterium]